MNTDDLQSVLEDLADVIVSSSRNTSINPDGQRAVLHFVARVVHVVEQAIQDVYILAVDVKSVRPEDEREIDRLERELSLVLMRSHAKAEGICGRLHVLREVFENDVSRLLNYSQGDARFRQLLRLLDEGEGRIILLIHGLVGELTSALRSLNDKAERDAARQTAEEAARRLRSELGELREIRDRILGLSGHAGLLELIEVSPDEFRREARALNVSITTGNLYPTRIANSTVAALAVGDHATSTGTVNPSVTSQAQDLQAVLERIRAVEDALATGTASATTQAQDLRTALEGIRALHRRPRIDWIPLVAALVVVGLVLALR